MKTIPTTNPVPFILETDTRGAQGAIKDAEKRKTETSAESVLREFRANPVRAPVEPFYATRSEKQPTEPEAVVMHSAVRAELRKVFDDAVHAREEEEKVMRVDAEKVYEVGITGTDNFRRKRRRGLKS
jgi:hypothetical protein